MPKKRATKPHKRGPKEERLVIPEESQEALTRLLKPATQVSSLKAAFDSAHKDGMDALKRHDFDALTDAVKRERKVVDAMKRIAPSTHGAK